MTFGTRFLLTIAIVLAIIFALALCGYMNGRWEESNMPFTLASAESVPEICMDEATKDAIRNVMLEALEHALDQHIVNAFSVWMKDPTGQPGRAKVGVERGVRAYINARKGVQEWNPPPCSG